METRRQPVREAQELLRRHGKRFPTFLSVGVAGLIVTFVGTVLLYHHAHLPLWLASGISIQLAILVTFTLNSQITWRDRPGSKRRRRFLVFEAVSLVGLGINEAILLTCVSRLHLYYLVALLLGSAVAAIWNYLVNHKVTFADRPLAS
ncbi:MAG TPA: GtrA family protein [Candidatus Dormibacteraeota bacterium]|nr:GtrA family protein [Candidatus Dormibacteraeota bacterium]